MLTEHTEYACVIFEAAGMKLYLVRNSADSFEPSLRIFHGNPANQPVNFVTETKQILGKIASVLTGNAGD
jgi:hypothetical protein